MSHYKWLKVLALFIKQQNKPSIHDQLMFQLRFSRQYLHIFQKGIYFSTARNCELYCFFTLSIMEERSST